MNKRRGNPIWRTLFLLVICVALCFALGSFLFWNHRNEAEEKAQLEALAQKEIEAEQRTAKDVQGEAETGHEAEEEKEEQEELKQEKEEEKQTETKTEVLGISCWGDEFFNKEEDLQYSYRSVLQGLLEENGYSLTVADKTLTGASTLSMMKMAGVPQEELDAYIEAHRQGANGNELPITETGIRDLTPEQTERGEADYIPVLFMGYYGGWNHDPQELIQQQQKILDTFQANKEKFVIIGLVPMDGSVDLATYDGAMKEAWGEHYISSAEVTTAPQAGREGQAQIAQALYDKLVEMEYISKI